MPPTGAGYGSGMSEQIFERDDYEQNDDGIINPEDTLSEGPMDSMLEQGYSPPETPRGLDAFGTTLEEEREGETLDQRLAQEEPDPNLDDLDLVNGNAEPETVGGEVGGARAGRLVDTDAGAGTDTEKDLVADDVGVDGAAAGAEEAAMHVIDLDEADAALARDEDEGSTLGSS